MRGGVVEAAQRLGGPAVDPDVAAGEAVQERQQFQPGEGGIDRGGDCGGGSRVLRQHAGDTLWRHRQVRDGRLQQDVGAAFAARDIQQLLQHDIARGERDRLLHGVGGGARTGVKVVSFI